VNPIARKDPVSKRRQDTGTERDCNESHPIHTGKSPNAVESDLYERLCAMLLNLILELSFPVRQPQALHHSNGASDCGKPSYRQVTPRFMGLTDSGPNKVNPRGNLVTCRLDRY
jgi:hypothetical protein